MNRNPNRRPMCVGTCSPKTTLAVWLGLCVMLWSNGYAQDHAATPAASTLLPGARDINVDSTGVRIHCVSLGRSDAPLVVLVHGFPDFWYSWRAQMPALARDFHVVAIDQRGYNLSGQPEGVENYTINKLVGDLLVGGQTFWTR